MVRRARGGLSLKSGELILNTVMKQEEADRGREEEAMQRAQHTGADGAGREVLAVPQVCADCSKQYALVSGASGGAELRCSCGGELVPAALQPGLYELGGGKKKKRHKKAAAHAAPATPREPDQGFNESHGYGPSHGGPTSPGDSPAAEAPINPPKPDEAKQKEGDPPSPDGPGSP